MLNPVELDFIKLTLLRRGLPVFLAACCAVIVGAGLESPVSAKKKPKINEEEVKSALEPIQKDVRALMAKIETRLFFTPEDNGKLDELKWQLLDMMALYNKSNLLVQPVYQAAVLFERRERLNDAYDLYQFLEATYPEDPIATKASFMRQKLEERFGASLFTLPKVALADDKATAEKK